jgi:hypothetical protein
MNIDDEKKEILVPLRVLGGEIQQANVSPDENEDGNFDEATIAVLKQAGFKKLAQLRKQEDDLIELLNLYETGDRDGVIGILKKKKRLDEFFLFFLDYLESPKHLAKAGGMGKYASLLPYQERAKRVYRDIKNENDGGYKQYAFAVGFVEEMAKEFEFAKENLEAAEAKLKDLEVELSSMDFKDRKGSLQSQEITSLKEEIRTLKRHPKPVSPDTVVTWLVGI